MLWFFINKSRWLSLLKCLNVFSYRFTHLLWALEDAPIESICVLHDDDDVDEKPSERRYQNDSACAHSHLSTKHSRDVCHWFSLFWLKIDERDFWFFHSDFKYTKLPAYTLSGCPLSTGCGSAFFLLLGSQHTLFPSRYYNYVNCVFFL